VKVANVDLLRSAASAADFPRDPLPQIAMLGRSNVGKSSLINALLKRTVARTSAAPGKTRLINLYTVTLAPGAAIDRFYLVDLPGYGYARGGAPSQAAFATLVQEYFACPPGGVGVSAAPAQSRAMPPRPGPAATTRGPAASARRGEQFGPTAILQLVDIRHPGLPQDVAAHDWLARLDRPCAVIATKSDKLSRADRSRALETWNNSLNSPVQPVSAASGEGMEDLWTLIVRLLTAHP
jgi:GTP-binding protein